MASIKHLKWLIIPVFAILLMSHNVSALELTQNVDSVYSWKNPKIWCMVFHGSLYSNGSDTCIVGTNTGTAWQGRGVSYIKTANINLVAGDFYQVYLDVAVSSGAQKQIPVMWNLGTTANYDIVSFRMVSQSNNLGTTADNEIYVTTYEIILKGLYNNPSFPIELGYPGGDINMIYLGGDFYTDSMDVRISRVNQYHPRSQQTNQDVVNSIENLSNSIEQQNEQENSAVDNISNQSADDYEMESANMSSLFSQFGGFISAVNGASIGDCTIPADFNHINLGILDMCKNPVPDYVQVAVSIVSCMLIAPYLMNIIKRILSIADKIREV